MDEKDILDRVLYLSLLMRDYTEEFSKGRLNIRTEVVESLGKTMRRHMVDLEKHFKYGYLEE